MAIRRIFIRSAVNPPDTTPPSTPSGTTVATTATTVTLSISTSTDNRSVLGYELEVGGTVLPGTYPPGQVVISNLTSATQYNIRVRAVDNSGNRSAFSSNISAATSGGTSLISWNPGHYAFPDHHMYPSKYELIEADINSLVTPVDKRSKIVGVRLLGTWGMFEPSPGTYDFSKLDYFISYAKARNLRVILSLNVRRYGGTLPSTPQADYRAAQLPDYLFTNGWAGLNTDDLGGYSARLDIADCMTAYIALITAIGERYYNEPYFEMFETGETSAAFAPGQGFSQSNWNTQWRRLPAALRAAFPNKPSVIDCNYHSSVSETNLLVDECITNGTGVGGPDTMPQNLGTTDDHWGFLHLGGVGVRVDPVYGPYDFGTTDSRGSIPAKAGQEVIQDTSYTPGSVYNHAYNVYKASHMTWTMHGDGVATRYGDPVPAMEWETGVWPYLRDNSVPLRTGFPTRLTALGYSANIGAT